MVAEEKYITAPDILKIRGYIAKTKPEILKTKPNMID